MVPRMRMRIRGAPAVEKQSGNRALFTHPHIPSPGSVSHFPLGSALHEHEINFAQPYYYYCRVLMSTMYGITS